MIFPLDVFEELIIKLGYKSLDDWKDFWINREEILNIASEFSNGKFRNDWIWGIVLPLLSAARNLIENNSKRNVIGLSALPGTGKSTLGILIEELSLKLNIKVSVISIDDFYLPSNEMEKMISDNPWKVSRGFPGSHSVNLMEESISDWIKTGNLRYPVFDKSLRGGLGDRSFWKEESPDLIILEGWFLGVEVFNGELNADESISPDLTSNEVSYRNKIQKNLRSYKNVWNLLDKIWHLKPQHYEYMSNWKCQQEKEMLNIKGKALKDNKLKDFIRMLITSIPHKSFDEIKSNALLILNQQRRLIWVGEKNINF